MATPQLSGDTSWAYFKFIRLFHIEFLKNGVRYSKSYYRQLIGNHTLAFDWCHFWWPWSTFEGHFSLCCHFHVHFSNPWHAFASHGLPAIAELLVRIGNSQLHIKFSSLFFHYSRLLSLKWRKLQIVLLCNEHGLPPWDPQRSQRWTKTQWQGPWGMLPYRSWADRPRRHNFPEKQLTKFHGVQTVNANWDKSYQNLVKWWSI